MKSGVFFLTIVILLLVSGCGGGSNQTVETSDGEAFVSDGVSANFSVIITDIGSNTQVLPVQGVYTFLTQHGYKTTVGTGASPSNCTVIWHLPATYFKKTYGGFQTRNKTGKGEFSVTVRNKRTGQLLTRVLKFDITDGVPSPEIKLKFIDLDRNEEVLSGTPENPGWIFSAGGKYSEEASVAGWSRTTVSWSFPEDMFVQKWYGLRVLAVERFDQASVTVTNLETGQSITKVFNIGVARNTNYPINLNIINSETNFSVLPNADDEIVFSKNTIYFAAPTVGLWDPANTIVTWEMPTDFFTKTEEGFITTGKTGHGTFRVSVLSKTTGDVAMRLYYFTIE